MLCGKRVRASGTAIRHLAWFSRVGLRPTDPRTRTAYQGDHIVGPPASSTTERDQALRKALEAARAIEDEGFRSAALAALAPHLTDAVAPARRWRRRGRSRTRGSGPRRWPRWPPDWRNCPLPRSIPSGAKRFVSRRLAHARAFWGTCVPSSPSSPHWVGQRRWPRPSARSRTSGGGGRDGRLVAGGLGEGDPRLPCRAPAGGLSAAGLHDARRRRRGRQPLQRLPGAQ